MFSLMMTILIRPKHVALLNTYLVVSTDIAYLLCIYICRFKEFHLDNH